ncbi:hypothetical protein [[Clostridium] scindens]|uniref:hypothetical protein n=1 Tax=Clostridium scindens (strain JCM 10418 / VPI 12708) TaxID=29347 RepID=UPI001D06C3B2|nr:hypothetical protein [[Clostridium] scindens]
MPESFMDYEPNMMLKLFVEHFKQNYEVECVGALPHNKRRRIIISILFFRSVDC